MGRFGFSKKDKDGEEDPNRLGLFGSRSKSKSPAPPSDNPYATAAAPPDPYTQAKMRAGVIQSPPGQNGPPLSGNGGMPNQPGQYGGGNSYGGSQGGYGANRYGNDKGYGGGGPGNNPYGGSNPNIGSARPGGYGGLGGANKYDNQDNDANKDELFGGARERVQQRQQNGPPDYAYNPASDPAESRSYGAYGDRQLTAEEEEEEDIQATKQEIRFMKQQDVASTRNILRVAQQSEETARNTLARLGAQGERLYNTEKNLNLAANKMTSAQDKTDELRRLNRSMFVPANNPFAGSKSRQKQEDKIVARHLIEQQAREDNRQQTYQANQRMNQNFKNLNASQGGATKQSLADRSKYQFEADSEDEAMEEEIDNNLGITLGAAKNLNLLSRALGAEIKQQNEVIDRIGSKSDTVQTDVVRQTERLKRIH